MVELLYFPRQILGKEGQPEKIGIITDAEVVNVVLALLQAMDQIHFLDLIGLFAPLKERGEHLGLVKLD
jgi:hypothetical protein